MPIEAYVWIWLPNTTEPIVAGRIEPEGHKFLFNYAQSYLKRSDCIPIYLPELPLQAGIIMPPSSLNMASCLRDAIPDAWGRRVILNKLFGREGRNIDTTELHELTYFLESGSDRIGALDFQESPYEYVPREYHSASIEELLSASESVEKGKPLTQDLNLALLHGTSIGGARPKAMIQDNNTKMIAKFSTSTDSYNLVKAEFVAMRLAQRIGLDVAPVKLKCVAGKDILVIERFDRVKKDNKWFRRAVVSALTLFELDEMMARYASYEDLAEIIRYRFTEPKKTLKEMFGRLVFNILCGNTDDHARNHAGFWDGQQLTLTPAYDICPQARAGNIASQAMLIVGNDRFSTLANCLKAAPNFLLRNQEAKEIIDQQIKGIRNNFETICKEANLTEVDRNLFDQRFFLNDFIFNGTVGMWG